MNINCMEEAQLPFGNHIWFLHYYTVYRTQKKMPIVKAMSVRLYVVIQEPRGGFG